MLLYRYHTSICKFRRVCSIQKPKISWQTPSSSMKHNWPSTEPSIKRCTSVNKRKNSGSRWTWNKNITRTRTAWCSWSWSQLGTRYPSESQQQTEGFGPSVTHSWATPAKMRKKCCSGQKNLGPYLAVWPRLQLTSHTQPTSTLSWIKCEIYVFIKKCVRSFIEVVIMFDYVPHILVFVYVLWVYDTMIYRYFEKLQNKYYYEIKIFLL